MERLQSAHRVAWRVQCTATHAEVQVAMSQESMKRQARGKAQTIIGRIARAIGRLFGNRELQVKGAAEEYRGRANVATGSAAERIEEAVKEKAGAVEEKVGAVRRSVEEAIRGDGQGVEGREREQARRDTTHP
jgi:uncharacterized protein YjbJ (UPF0337 family)